MTSSDKDVAQALKHAMRAIERQEQVAWLEQQDSYQEMSPAWRAITRYALGHRWVPVALVTAAAWATRGL